MMTPSSRPPAGLPNGSGIPRALRGRGLPARRRHRGSLVVETVRAAFCACCAALPGDRSVVLPFGRQSEARGHSTPATRDGPDRSGPYAEDPSSRRELRVRRNVRGPTTTRLEPALRVRANQARRCYDRALLQDSTLRGHVTVVVRVGPTGAVCSATVASNDMPTPDVANCAANIFRSTGSLPAPRGGCIDAPVPLSFVPQGQ